MMAVHCQGVRGASIIEGLSGGLALLPRSRGIVLVRTNHTSSYAHMLVILLKYDVDEPNFDMVCKISSEIAAPGISTLV